MRDHADDLDPVARLDASLGDDTEVVAGAFRFEEAAHHRDVIEVPSLKHGNRGCVTMNSAEPIRKRSPLAIAFSRGMPSTVRFSPNTPQRSGRSSSLCQYA
jgi:hypothetical protein